MRTLPLLAGFAFISVTAGSRRPAKRHYSTHNYYVLEHDPSHGVSVEDAANALGAEVIEPAGELKNHWLLRSQISDNVLDALHDLKVTGRRKRDARILATSIKSLDAQTPRQRHKRGVLPVKRATIAAHDGQSLARNVAERFGINDPLFPEQWHLVNDDHPEHMMNVTPVWEMGFTGEGVISALVDDGLEYESEDLAENFDAAGSHDFNDHVDLPKPRLWDDHHGTRCAGQIAAVKNGACGIGVAYKSKVAGIRILSGAISDVDEATAMNFGYQKTSIYSCSWGPPDDGRSMDAPSHLIQKAIVNGIQNGRGGKGSIFVFASGNGAFYGDQCNFDGYTNSIYSVTVGAIDHKGVQPYYSEGCAANMVVAYSSGEDKNKAIVTTDMGKNACTHVHGGTSAAAPNAVGVFALALSARPELSWRDIQHLAVKTAQLVNAGDKDWQLTAGGQPFSYKYGFGKLDAYEFVKAAQKWTLVKPQAWVEMSAVQLNNGTMTVNGTTSGGIQINKSGVRSSMEIMEGDLKGHNFETLEHVTVTVWISHSVRGDVEVEIVSPNGIPSVLASKRPSDRDPNGFQGWRFMSVKHWGENPVGNWTIQVSDQGKEDRVGHFIGWKMSLWGSAIDASKATTYQLSFADRMGFPPPHPSELATLSPPTATQTKSYAKPTVVSTHIVDLEAETPTISLTTPTATISPSVEPSAGFGTWTFNDGFADAILHMLRQTWVLAILGGFVIFAIAGGATLIYRRRVSRESRGEYTAVADEEAVLMRSTGAEGSTTNLGRQDRHERGDDEGDDDAGDEHAPQGSLLNNGYAVEFHSGFLEDDENTGTPRYHDEPPHRTDGADSV